MLDIAIIGAGPYGLSLATHLKAANISFRIFGKPMLLWREQMPAGMYLKSDAYSSDLPDPNDAYKLERFHAQHGKPFNRNLGISLDTFVAYGLEFQSRMVPEVEQEDVVSVESVKGGYLLRLSNQEQLQARQVVVAVGVYAFRYLPPVLAGLPKENCSHSAEYGPVTQFRGKKVAVVGSGASAIDLAIALADEGVDTTIISRRASIGFQTAPSNEDRSFYARLRRPDTGIGRGWPIKICADMPHVVHAFPAALRSYIVRTKLGPQPGWVSREKIAGRVPILSRHTPRSAQVANGKVSLTLETSDGTTRSHEFDHVIGATGYRPDVKKLPFLSDALRQNIRTYEDAPVLSRRFESSAPGLYFIGPAAAMSFGPVMRFVFGARFTMKTIMKRFSRQHAGKKADLSQKATAVAR